MSCKKLIAMLMDSAQVECNMAKKKIYISGAITGNPAYKMQFLAKYRELEPSYTVLSPLFINAELSWKDFMHIDLAMIKVCDAIYMLKGWEESRGAKIEHCFAQMLGLEIIYENEDAIVKTCWNCIHRNINGGFAPCSTCENASAWELENEN